MPIYGNSLLEVSWKRVMNITRKDYEKYQLDLKKIINSEFKDDSVFRNSIDYKKDTYLSLLHFDNSKTGIESYNYIKNIEKIINLGNKKLPENLKFDILGTWTNGSIILMKK